jgi:cell wall-associated NlpC family hydrolase
MADAAAEEQFGPYLVYERLGVGGMATVHRAREHGPHGFERVVALKRLLPHLAEDASFIKSFVREAKLASLLTHLNIVQIYELGRVGTEYFISMEYIDGRDVRQILRHARKATGPAPIHVTVGLILQLCEALDYAHTKIDDTGLPLGLVHRDVSPSNLLVTVQGHLKVIDFGIAKAQSAQLRTQTGRVKGKLAYMAPEAISGSRDLDARSDVWAVGVILHELLTARPLFASKNEYQTLLKVQRGDIMPPSTFNQACPPELDAIVFKALERDADQRFASAAELRVELDRVRRQYHLHTGFRDIAQWLDWAFAIESPSGFSGNTLEPSQISISMQTPQPARAQKDEEDAVEIAWGGGEVGAPSGPIVLDDVPDVSGKHRAITVGLDEEAEAEARAQAASADDIPASQPTHGPGPRVRPRTATVPPADPCRPSPMPRSDSDVEAASALSIEDLFGDKPEPPREPLREPIVRFSSSKPYPIQNPADELLVPAGLAPLRPPPRTKPGVTPASAHRLSERNLDAAPTRTRQVTIGAALVERNQSKRGYLLAGALLLVGGGAAMLAWYATRGPPVAVEPAPPAAASREPGTVKFQTEPADAEIQVGDRAHAGSPWQLELAPGVHQIEIRHAGYKAWLTSLELSPRETQTLRVVLEPLGTAATADATLVLSTTPSDLEVVVDGQVQQARTPLKLPLKPGTHAVVVRQNGVEVWKQMLNAASASTYEFNPSFTADKQRERDARGPAPSQPADTLTIEAAPTTAPAPSEAAHVVAPAAMLVPAVPVPAPAPAPAGTAAPAEPLTVAPNAVAKISGTVPNIVRATRDLPPVAAAKLCIDATGAVTSVDFISKLDHRVATDLGDALKSWRYQPYKHGGTPVSACFAVTLRLKN